MALDDALIKELLKRLDQDREAYLATLTRTHELLAKAVSTKSTASPAGALEPVPETTELWTASELTKRPGVPESLGQSSTFSAEDEDGTDDESLFVQEMLPAETYSEEQLRDHLKRHNWNEQGRNILGSLIRDHQYLDRPSLFPLDAGLVADRSHVSHHNVYEVGTDGAPLPHRPSPAVQKISKSLAIWQSLNLTNADPTKQRRAVGKIIIIREPSPILFGAIHLTMNQHFDMDEIFTRLVDSSPTRAYMNRAFAPEPRQQRTFVVVLKYFTIIGEDCKPKSWQQSDAELKGSNSHIPITRCCSTVALSLTGEPTSTVKNRARRAKTEVGNVYDPFSPWRVLSVQCFPDWKSTMDSHDSTKHYVNGPEAFLITLLTEYRDAQKRFMEIHKRIVALATPPVSLTHDFARTGSLSSSFLRLVAKLKQMDFLFNDKTRDDLLFEDNQYTYSRRYFWCFQTLAIMSDNIEAMIDAYRDTFTDDVWSGRHKTIWPGLADTSSRYTHWRRRMGLLRKDLEREVAQLERILWLNYREQKDIQALRDHLFSGTSVLESRKSVEQASITVQQGHNIKLLTLVTIFFLPLTFVTSIFGMTNMPPGNSFKPFGIVLVIICVPSYMLIGSLNSTRGLQFWSEKSKALLRHIANAVAWLFRSDKRISKDSDGKGSGSTNEDGEIPLGHLDRSQSTQANMAIRYGEPNDRSDANSHTPTFTSQHEETPTEIKFHPLTYGRRLSDARRVSVSNIGPLTDLADAEAQDTRRGFMQSISEQFEWNQPMRQSDLRRDLC